MSNVLVKLYDKDETFKETISGKRLSNYPQFSSILGVGHTDLNLRYYTDFDSTDIEHYDIVKVIDSDGSVLYRGSVVAIERVYRGADEYLSIQATGMHVHFKKTLYDDGGSYTFTKNVDPRVIIEDIVDTVNAKFSPNLFSYTTSTTTVDRGTTVDIEFDNDDCWTAIKKVLDLTDYMFFIDGDGVVHFKPGTTSYVDSHMLTMQNNVIEVQVAEESDDLYNDYRLGYTGGTQTGNDSSSETSYGTHTKYISEQSIQDSATATERIDAELSKNKNPIEKITVVVNDRYDIESIKVGDLVSVGNIGYSITNKRVHKISYGVTEATLFLEGYNSIEQSLNKII